MKRGVPVTVRRTALVGRGSLRTPVPRLDTSGVVDRSANAEVAVPTEPRSPFFMPFWPFEFPITTILGNSVFVESPASQVLEHYFYLSVFAELFG